MCLALGLGVRLGLGFKVRLGLGFRVRLGPGYINKLYIHVLPPSNKRHQ